MLIDGARSLAPYAQLHVDALGAAPVLAAPLTFDPAGHHAYLLTGSRVSDLRLELLLLWLPLTWQRVVSYDWPAPLAAPFRISFPRRCSLAVKRSPTCRAVRTSFLTVVGDIGLLPVLQRARPNYIAWRYFMHRQFTCISEYLCTSLHVSVAPASQSIDVKNVKTFFYSCHFFNVFLTSFILLNVFYFKKMCIENLMKSFVKHFWDHRNELISHRDVVYLVSLNTLNKMF